MYAVAFNILAVNLIQRSTSVTNTANNGEAANDDAEIDNSWELNWIHAKIDTSETNMNKIKSALDTQDKVRKDKRLAAFAEGTKPNYFEILDLNAKRITPLVRVFIEKVATNEKEKSEIWRCSGSFIKPDLVMTAAHCFTELGITTTSGHIIYLVQEYGISDPDGDKPIKHQSTTKKARNFAVEWWYNSAYATKYQRWLKSRQRTGNCEQSGYDFAFIRTQFKTTGALYTPMEPEVKGPQGSPDDYSIINLQDKEVISMGWTIRYLDGKKAVGVKGLVKRGQYSLWYPSTWDDVMPNQLSLCDPIHSEGVIGHGGSGGPWILSDAGLAKFNSHLKAKLEMGVFAVTGWQADRMGSNCIAAPVITAKLLKVIGVFDKYEKTSQATTFTKPESLKLTKRSTGDIPEAPVNGISAFEGYHVDTVKFHVD